MKKLSVNENLVIQELFKNPHLSLDDLAELLNNASDRRTLNPNKSVDLRSVSKFKSVGYKKIREGLEKLADDFRLDYSLQSEEELEKKKEKDMVDLLKRNGIFIGHDYRIDKKITLFFSLKDQSIIPWQDHICNRNCETECFNILSLIRQEHGLKALKIESPFRNHFESTINEIVQREMTPNE